MLQVCPFFTKKKTLLNRKFNGHIAQFFDTSVFSYVGSDFTVGKGAFEKVTLLKINREEIVLA